MRLFGRRAYPREPIQLAAELIAGRGASPAMLHDLSVKGARLTVAHPPELGSEVVLRWACFVAVGRVAWVEGRGCGLEFDRQLDAQVVITTQAVSSEGHQVIPPVSKSLPASTPVRT